MPEETAQSRSITAALLLRAGPDATPERIAELICAVWGEIDAALSPVLGQRGVGALFARSLSRVAADLPWLNDRVRIDPTATDPSAWSVMLADRDAADALAVTGRVLQAFHDLLSSLIGLSLTERLLRSVWVPFMSGTAAEDISS